MGKSNITLPIKRNDNPALLKNKTDEKKIRTIINKGGSTSNVVQASDEMFKNFNIKILESELSKINELRDKLPKPRGKRMAISLHDWIIEAIKEKIDRDQENL